MPAHRYLGLPVGRKRKAGNALPVHVQRKGNAYYFVIYRKGVREWRPLGSDLGEAIKMADKMNYLLDPLKRRKHGLGNVRSAVLERDGFRCVYCGTTDRPNTACRNSCGCTRGICERVRARMMDCTAITQTSAMELQHDLAQYQARDAERETRIAALERDAARYRWLRRITPSDVIEGYVGTWPMSDTEFDSAVDAGIANDAARAALEE